MASPIETILDRVQWAPISPMPMGDGSEMPYATHFGIVDFGGRSIRCYQLSDGRRVIEKGDLFEFFGLSEAEWNALLGTQK